MTSADIPARHVRYIIGAASGYSLSSLLPRLRADSQLELLDGGGPHLALAKMTPAHAAELRARYAGQLVIERDAALDPSTDKP